MYLPKPFARGIIALTAILPMACGETGTGTDSIMEESRFQISSITPVEGTFGTEVTISGRGFSDIPAENVITFNGLSAEVLASSPTALKTTVPKGAGSGAVKVRVGKKTATGPSFIYLPTVHVSTYAGSGSLGFRDGESTHARFNYPVGLELAPNGELIVVDHWNHSIRIITPDGYVQTLAGDGTGGFRDGPGSRARFFRPTDAEVTGEGNIFISDFGNHRIRYLANSGSVTTFSGTVPGYRDGPPNVAQFNFPAGIALAENDTLYVSDSGSSRIRWVTSSGEVGTYAGSGERGFENGYGQMAQFHFPFGMDLGPERRIFVADYGNNSIRLISSKRVVSTFSGDGEPGYMDEAAREARFNAPYDVAVDKHNRIYVADFYNHRIRRISPQREVINIAGNGEPGLVDGEQSNARFNGPIGLAINEEGTVLFVADHHNHVIRKVTIQ
ncbi:IPT/TIG domain-containing protein [Halalkalibaculum sp. DA3122]|uniref:IPT/TIG domain-containing protein n=1 Tax=unclassified Halalkalibaculum TaxID=2964617 RepID=UPI0037542E1F